MLRKSRDQNLNLANVNILKLCSFLGHPAEWPCAISAVSYMYTKACRFSGRPSEKSSRPGNREGP